MVPASAARNEHTVAETQFPKGFVWGVATSSYQIEGSIDADGRRESIWDRFASTPGKIEDETDGSIACDHYRRWETDVALISSIGANAYRFSIAWPRLFPKGTGAFNTSGFAFYDRLVDRLLENRIDPTVTLYHWDLPQTLQDRGGWSNRDTAKAFADYAHETTRRLGDRVKRWVTHNEPWCVAMLGHDSGAHAPGIKDRRTALAAAHHVLLSHGMAVPAMRDAASNLEIGIVHILSPGYPASDSDVDRDATRVFDEDFNLWFVEPGAHGRYPAAALERYRRSGAIDETHPVVSHPEDLRTMSVPTDFIGINYYSRAIIRADVPEPANRPQTLFPPPSSEKTDMDWEVYPDGLHNLLMRATNEWRAKKIFVTECGAAYSDGPDSDGRINDTRRIKFLDGHFRSAHRAIIEGAPLAGIFVWSLLDNFEWAFGYTKRFGIVWVDYETQKRTLKESARWYQNVIHSNGL